jgi:AcrR family transcriptional regulator
MLAKGRRARTDEAKLERRNAVVAMARLLLTNQSIRSFNMADVAKSADIAKGTLYLYFESREALLLEILWADLKSFFAALNTNLPPLRRVPHAFQAAAKLTLAEMQTRPLLGELLQHLHTTIEPGLTPAHLTGFKYFLLENLEATGKILETTLALPKNAGSIALLRAHALIIGFNHMTNRPKILRDVFAANPDLQSLDFTLEESLLPALADQWRALGQSGNALG